MQKKYMSIMMLISCLFTIYSMDVSDKTICFIPLRVKKEINEIDVWYKQQLKDLQERKADIYTIDNIYRNYNVYLAAVVNILINNASSHNTILTALFHFKERCDNERINTFQNMIKAQEMYPQPGSILFKELSFGQYIVGNQV